MGPCSAPQLTMGMTQNTAHSAVRNAVQNATQKQDATRQTTVVVTGASGRTGGRVAEAAAAAGLTVRAASRAQGFDWYDGSTWADVLRGADAAYLVYPTDVGAPDAADAVGRLSRDAVALGVRRLVLLSSRGEERALPTEEALRASGADWTVVRASWFAQTSARARWWRS